MDLTKVRFRGLDKNTGHLLTLFALSNLWAARRSLSGTRGTLTGVQEPLSDSLKGLRGLPSMVSDVDADIRPSFSSTSATSGRLDPVAHGGPHLNVDPNGAGGRQGARTAPGVTVVEWGGSGDKRENPLKARLSRYLRRVLLGLLAFMALALYLAQKIV